MVKQIQGKYKVNSPDLKPLWQEAKNRIARLEAFEITHALRHKNKAADALANQAMDRGMNRTPAPNSPIPEKKLSSFATAGGPALTLPKGPAGKKLSSGKEQSSGNELSSEKKLSSFAAGGGPASRPSPQPNPEPASKPTTMLRGFTRDGVIHLLGSATLPDGIFVKVIPE